MTRRLTAWVTLAALSTLTFAQREVIRSFDADIFVNADGSIVVTETIEVVARGDQIKRGIYRELPTLARGPYYTRLNPAFTVLGVTRDGQNEPYAIEPIGGGLRIRIGRENRKLSPGPHTFAISYEAKQQLRHHETVDELYWNVTGDGWAFPIERASATVSLPAAAGKPTSIDVYTGRAGQAGADATSTETADGAEIKTARTLAPGEGLTISVAWPAGAVTRPSTNDRIAAMLGADPYGATVLAGAFGVVIYYIVAWWLRGRSAPSSVLPPRDKPPEALSPASCRVLKKRKYDNTAFAAGILNLGVAGVFRITERDGGGHDLERLDGEPRFNEERTLLKRLFKKGATKVTIGDGPSAAAADASGAFGGDVKVQHFPAHIVRNRGVWFLGLVWFALAVIVGLVLTMLADQQRAIALGFFSAFISLWSVGVTALTFGALAIWASAFDASKTPTARSLVTVGAVLFTAFAVPFWLAELFVLREIMRQSSILAPIGLGMSIAAAAIAFFALRRITPEGRRLMDEIDAYERFLDNFRANPATDRLEALQEHLPYAVALDREREWGEQFEEIAQQMLESDPEDIEWLTRRQHIIPWYIGATLSDFTVSDLSSSVGNSVSGSLASSSSISSSGMGGGGSVGGGGGGGGGGGW